MTSRLRNAFVTWNNYPDNFEEVLSGLPEHSYIVVGKEIGPKEKTPHLHVYVEFTQQHRWKKIVDVFPPGTDVQKAKGSPQQASDYCKKDHDYREEGTIKNPGKRNDLDTVREILKTGGEREVMDQATSVTAVRFAQMYLKVKERKRRFKPTVIWLYGKAGLGKTRTAMYDAWRRGYGEDVHLQCGQGKWWEGYDAHKAVIIDDIREDFFSFTRALNILDRYECRLENKGGSRQLLARVIYITSPLPPDEVWNTREEMKQLERRIDIIQEILSDTEYIVHKGDGVCQEKPQDYPEDDQEEATNSEQGDQAVCEEIDASD